MKIASLIGPRIYGDPKPNKKCISVNIDLDDVRSSKFLNFTGYTWLDQKYGFALKLIETSYNKIIIHDSDYLRLDTHAEVLIKRGHTVCFVLSPREWSVKNMGDKGVFGGAPASNKRIRAAYEHLKSLGVSVKKFQNPLALEKYLNRSLKAVPNA